MPGPPGVQLGSGDDKHARQWLEGVASLLGGLESPGRGRRCVCAADCGQEEQAREESPQRPEIKEASAARKALRSPIFAGHVS
jgi:hypothetical protein